MATYIHVVSILMIDTRNIGRQDWNLSILQWKRGERYEMNNQTHKVENKLTTPDLKMKNTNKQITVEFSKDIITIYDKS